MQASSLYIFISDYSLLSIRRLWKYLPIRHFLHIYWETYVNTQLKNRVVVQFLQSRPPGSILVKKNDFSNC
jgi:hypothetical protein